MGHLQAFLVHFCLYCTCMPLQDYLFDKLFLALGDIVSCDAAGWIRFVGKMAVLLCINFYAQSFHKKPVKKPFEDNVDDIEKQTLLNDTSSSLAQDIKHPSGIMPGEDVPKSEMPTDNLV